MNDVAKPDILTIHVFTSTGERDARVRVLGKLNGFVAVCDEDTGMGYLIPEQTIRQYYEQRRKKQKPVYRSIRRVTGNGENEHEHHGR